VEMKRQMEGEPKDVEIDNAEEGKEEKDEKVKAADEQNEKTNVEVELPEIDASTVDVFSVEDVSDLGNCEPLFQNFEHEDWVLFTTRCELHLLLHAWKKDLDDIDRPSFVVDHLPFYYNKYIGKQFNANDFAVSEIADVVKFVDDTVKINGGSGYLECLTPVDSAFSHFVKLTEQQRRNRNRRADAGDEGSVIKFPKRATPPNLPPPRPQGSFAPTMGHSKPAAGLKSTPPRVKPVLKHMLKRTSSPVKPAVVAADPATSEEMRSKSEIAKPAVKLGFTRPLRSRGTPMLPARKALQHPWKREETHPEDAVKTEEGDDSTGAKLARRSKLPTLKRFKGLPKLKGSISAEGVAPRPILTKPTLKSGVRPVAGSRFASPSLKSTTEDTTQAERPTYQPAVVRTYVAPVRPAAAATPQARGPREPTGPPPRATTSYAKPAIPHALARVRPSGSVASVSVRPRERPFSAGPIVRPQVSQSRTYVPPSAGAVRRPYTPPGTAGPMTKKPRPAYIPGSGYQRQT